MYDSDNATGLFPRSDERFNWFQIVKRRISKNIGFICIVIESLVCGVPMSSGKDVMDGYKSQSDAG